MRRLRGSALLLIFPLQLLPLDAQAGVGKGSKVTIKLRSGKTLTGEVIAETANGLLVKTSERTEMAKYTDVEEITDLGAPAQQAPSPPPATVFAPPASSPELAPPRTAQVEEER